MFKLVIEDDEGNKTVVPIIRDEITIGRKDGHTIRLTERNVSRNHARLVRKDGEVYFEDVSARYGSRKNGQRVDGRTEFGVGDVFTIGDYRLTLQSDVAPEAKPPKKPNGASAKEQKFSSQPTQITKIDSTTDREGTEIIAADPAKLVIISSNFAGQEFPLARREMVIGRGEECDIIIDHRSVSQTHAKVIREQSGEYKIVDLKSKNGVKVGGEDYRAVHLKRGDIIDLGHVKFRFVEAGENYVFTPPIDDDSPARPASSKGLLVLGAVFVALLSIAAGYFILGGGRGVEPEPVLASPSTPDGPAATNAAAPDAPPPEVAENDLDAKIDKAEQDYRAGHVQKAAGMLELLRDEKEVSPEQVDRIDRLLSMTKRERGFVRYFENGRDHFEAGRWMEALAEFRQIPDDPELNIYRLVRDGDYIDKAVASAADEQLNLARDADDGKIREGAREKLTELAALYPGHAAPPEALAALTAMAEATRPTRPAAATRPSKPSKPTREPADAKVTEPTKPSGPEPDPERARDLHKQAMTSLFANDYGGCISQAEEARKYGCTTDCYRVLGMCYHKQGESAKACRWFAKANQQPPEDLDCP